jgi:hypothetical protein
MKLKSLLLTASLFILSAFSMAQTPYSNNSFAVTFTGGAVTSSVQPNDAKTSTNYDYTSSNADVSQTVDTRIIDHDIAVSQASSDFYADLDTSLGTVINRSAGLWQGHPFTYTFVKFVGNNGLTYSLRTRFIIVRPREAIFIMQTSLMTFEDQAIWEQFEGTLNIK